MSNHLAASVFSKTWKICAATTALILSAGTVQRAEAQCPNGTSQCANQVVPMDESVPYQQDPRTRVNRVILYDNAPAHTAGKHAIRRAMIKIANKYGFELVIDDAAIGWINAERLANTDVVIFSQGDRDVVSPPGSPSDVALQGYIYRDGGSMLMMHAASAFITCPGVGTAGGGHDIADPDCRFMARATARQYYHHQNAGSPARIYVDSVFPGQVPPYQTCQNSGCTSVGPHTAAPEIAQIPHGKVNPETKNMFDNTVTYNWPLPPNSTSDARTFVWDNLADEWYEWYNNPGPREIDPMVRTFDGVQYLEDRLNILLSMDETSRYLAAQRMGDHPLSWVRKMGNGLAGYNNIGHDNSPYGNARTGSGLGVDSMAQAYLWNFVRFLARDYVGCMTEGDDNYVPWASVTTLTASDPAQPCSDSVVSIAGNSGRSFAAAKGVTSFNGGVQVETPNEGFYRVHVSDMKGRQVFSKAALGGHGRKVEVPELSKGTYVVHVTNPAKEVGVARVQL